jgi:hypothetical protein
MNRPAPALSNPSSLRVKGRMMLHEKFTERLQNFCTSLGFNQVNVCNSELKANTPGDGRRCLPTVATGDAVILLSCRVAYNPDWGGHCGLPQLRIRETNGDWAEHCPAAFIAPFLRQYRFAQEHIYLSEPEPGNHLITLPIDLLQKGDEKPGCRLRIDLGKVAEPDRDGALVPVMISGSMTSYPLAQSLRQTLDCVNFAWRPTRSIPIGSSLGSDLFSFIDIEQSAAPDSPFWPTLLPHLGTIVTDRTPHLRAAEIHLSQQFKRTVATCLAEDLRPGFGNILCLAGLDIDMTVFRGHHEHYFVPWKAYLDTTNDDQGVTGSLDQDDLFVRLMQQN